MKANTHTSHKTTCVNTSFMTAYHSVWAHQPIAIRLFLGGRKYYPFKPCVLLNSCRKEKKMQFILCEILAVNNSQQILVLSHPDHTYGMFERKQAEGKVVCHKSHGNPFLLKCLPLNHLLPLCSVCTPTSTYCSMHTHIHTHKYWASLCMFCSCANTDQTMLTGPCLWHSSGCLYCNFLSSLIHVLSSIIPAGLGDAFITLEHQEKCKEDCCFAPPIEQCYHRINAAVWADRWREFLFWLLLSGLSIQI